MQASSSLLRKRAAQQPFRAAPAAGRNAIRRPVAFAAAPRTGVRLQAAAVEAAPAEQVQQQVVVAQPQDDESELVDMEMAELDLAMENVLGWALAHNEEEQEKDLDEMVDYDEFGDDEYAELYPTVESLVESSYSDIRVGDRVVGTVYEVDEAGAYVEIGEKASGFVPLAECSFAKLKTPLEVLRVGMQREFVVVNREDSDGQLVLSLAAMEASVMWQRMQQMRAEGAVVHVKVDSANKGGLLVQYGQFDGFLPVGQFGPSITLENMESLVGSEIPVQFLDVDEEGERLVFSNKRAAGTVTAPTDIKMGDVVEGTVQVIKPYGVFVDIGGLTGLLHVSQVSNDRITSLEKLFKEGDKIKVMVLSIDRDRGRITLSTKKLEMNKGEMLRDPQSVYEKAEEAADHFKQRMAAAAAQMMSNPDLPPVNQEELAATY